MYVSIQCLCTFLFLTKRWWLCAGVNGYVSGSMYKKLDGQRWVRNTIVTVLLLFGPTFVVWAFLNSVAWAYGSAQALPPSTVALLLVIYVLGTQSVHIVAYCFV